MSYMQDTLNQNVRERQSSNNIWYCHYGNLQKQKYKIKKLLHLFHHKNQTKLIIPLGNLFQANNQQCHRFLCPLNKFHINNNQFQYQNYNYLQKIIVKDKQLPLIILIDKWLIFHQKGLLKFITIYKGYAYLIILNPL
jgi:hypothetical protein